MPIDIPWPKWSFPNSEPVQARAGGAPGAKALAGLRRAVGGLGGSTQIAHLVQESSPPRHARADDAANMPGMARRPGYTGLQTTYSAAKPAARMGTLPKLAYGGLYARRMGTISRPGTAAQLPANVDTQDDYQPAGLEYAPRTNPNRMAHPPRSIDVGTDGRMLMSTYTPHDFTIGTYTQNFWASSAMWEQLENPTSFRQLLLRQQAMKYDVASAVTLGRPVSPQDYFLGYRTSMRVAAQMGASAFMPMGQGGA